MSNIYVGVCLILCCVFLIYLPTFLVTVTVILSLIFAYSFLKDDYKHFLQLASTHVARLYHKTCEFYHNISENMNIDRNISTGVSLTKSLQNNGAVRNKLDKLSPVHQSGSHNLGSPLPLERYTMNVNRPGWISNNNVGNTRPISGQLGLYHNDRTESQNSIVNFSLSSSPRQDYKNDSIDSKKQHLNTSLFMGHSPQTPRKHSVSSHSSNSLSESNSTLNSKSSKSLDARLYANVNSPGFCSRLADNLAETMTHQPKYDSVGAFPVVHLKSNPSKIKIKTPVRVRLTPRSNEVSYSSVGMNSMSGSPLSAATDESMKSVLQVLKEISRKRIHSNVEDNVEDKTKRLRVNDIPYNSDGVLHATLLQQTIQGKRAREETSPVEEDVKKKRKPLKNNEITSSLSSSLSIKPPHLKSTKRKAPDIDDSVCTTPTMGKQLKIQTEVTPPFPRPSVTSAEPSAIQERAVPKDVDNSTRIQSPLQTEKPSIPEEPKTTSPAANSSISEKDDDKTVSRLLGRLSSPIDDTSSIDVPVKKNVFMSTNDLSLSPPKENRLAAMIAVLGGPREELEGITADSENVKQSERNSAVKSLFSTPATPETPKQHKKVTFSNTLTETKIFDTEKCASPLSVGSSVENSNTKQSSINTKPFNINFGFSPSSTTEELKQTSSTNKSDNSEKSISFSAFPLATPKTTINSPGVKTSESTKASPSFNFAVSSPGQLNQEKTSTSLSSDSFSFGNGSKTPSVASNDGSQAPLEKANVTNESNKPTASLGFNLFSNQNATTSVGKGEEKNIKSDAVKTSQLVNGISSNTESKSTAMFSFGSSVSQASPSKSFFPNLSQQLNGPIQPTARFNFNSSPSVPPSLSKVTEATASTVSSQPTQSNNLFSSSKISDKPSLASNVSKTETEKTNNLFGIKSTSGQSSGTSQSSLLGNNIFGGNVSGSKVSQNTTVQNGNLFANISSTTSKSNIVPITSTQNSLGFPAITTSAKDNAGQLGSTNNTVSQSKSFFGNISTTSQSTMFGNVSTNTSTQIGSLLSTSTANTTQSAMFSSPTSTTTFGSQVKSSISGFSTQNTSNTNSTASNAFGSQSTNSGFGGKNNSTSFNFGSANSSSVTQSGFGTSGAFNLSTNTSSTSEVKPAFSSSTFTFGSSTTTGNKESEKPFGAAAPFSFVGNSQQTTNQATGNPAQTTLPTFGTSNTGFGLGQQTTSFSAGVSQPAAPAFSSGISQTTTPAFGAGVSQPATTAFGAGVSQPATPTFGTGLSQPATTAFGAGVSQPATPTFGAGISQATTPVFGAGISQTTTPAFGTGLSQPATTAFGAGVSQPVTPTFGAGISQPTTSAFGAGVSQPATPTFGAGITQPTTPAFGAGITQPTTPAFGAGISQATTPAFGAGISQATTPAFGAGVSQPATPTFGAGTIQPTTPAFGTGISQPAAPAFGTGMSQPSAPAFNVGISQPAAASGFAFGQQPATAPAFQFNATTPQPVQGGMFSIGSGGSSAPRKTGALRRRHKPT